MRELIEQRISVNKVVVFPVLPAFFLTYYLSPFSLSLSISVLSEVFGRRFESPENSALPSVLPSALPSSLSLSYSQVGKAQVCVCVIFEPYLHINLLSRHI